MANKQAKILVTGSVAYDRIMNFPGLFKNEILPEKVHILNVSFLVNELKEGFGGTGGNIAYNLALLGLKPVLMANVGAKDFSFYQVWLKKHRIDLSALRVWPGQNTASAYIITDQDDNQISGFYPGAMSKPIIGNKFSLAGIKLAIISPQNPIDMIKLPLLFKQKKIDYIFDPGQQVTSLTGNQLCSAIAGSLVLIGNDYEINLISQKTKWSVDQLSGKTNTLITTLGSKGSIIRQGSKVYKIKSAKPKNSSDPTGAGDAYRAGLIYGLLHGWPLAKVGQFAGLVSVYTVEKYGTQTHQFTWTDLQNRYRRNFGQKL
ncbi:MAG: carbohydrate kinase family protein [Patescibacteria group bacterium]|jgi:adenosine kinase|nr:carbohydrate kinase family protein [Patescibacteria group bacterium]